MGNNEENKVTTELNENDLTREINLDELYDGAINNTVVIDPVTNNEVLLENKKPNYALIGAVFAVLSLLVLYYVNNKTNLTKETPEVMPNTTTTAPIISTTQKQKETGFLNCKYDLKSDSETSSVTYVLNYEEDLLVDSTFTYTITSNTDTSTATIDDLKNQYETLYISNAASLNNKFSYEPSDKGFTFTAVTNYKNTDFSEVNTEEGKNILYVKPSKEDTYESLKEKYEQHGFTCSLTGNENINN